MTPELRDAVSVALGRPITSVQRVAGGDINLAFQVTLTDGTAVFVKHRPDAGAGTYAAEAHGLRWLAAAGALRTPEVIAVGDDHPRFLVLEWIAGGAPAATHDEVLGRCLARLHGAGAPSFGLDRPNALATLSQDNTPTTTWAEFWATRRIAPLVRRGVDAGLLDAATLPRWNRLGDRMTDLCGPAEPPARLHGDLWGGNAITGADGMPVLIDPAVYGGHREVDLAMMRLFGGFSERVFAAYEEAAPLAPGAPDRVPLSQLAPLLVHLVLFGAGYRASVLDALGRYA